MPGEDTAELDACHRAEKRREGAQHAGTETIAEVLHIFEVQPG
jgi:hypothetical protein